MQSLLVSGVYYGFSNCNEGQGMLGLCRVESVV